MRLRRIIYCLQASASPAQNPFSQEIKPTEQVKDGQNTQRQNAATTQNPNPDTSNKQAAKATSSAQYADKSNRENAEQNLAQVLALIRRGEITSNWRVRGSPLKFKLAREVQLASDGAIIGAPSGPIKKSYKSNN